jgi:hypothetical protein
MVVETKNLLVNIDFLQEKKFDNPVSTIRKILYSISLLSTWFKMNVGERIEN